MMSVTRHDGASDVRVVSVSDKYTAKVYVVHARPCNLKKKLLFVCFFKPSCS